MSFFDEYFVEELMVAGAESELDVQMLELDPLHPRNQVAWSLTLATSAVMDEGIVCSATRLFHLAF